MVEPLALRRERQTFAFSLLAPLMVLAVLVWLVDGPALRVTAGVFVAYATALLSGLPTELQLRGLRWGRLAAGAAVGGALALLAAHGGWLALAVGVLLALLILRLVYQRQRYRQRGQPEAAELMRRCLLIALWTHMSVFAALVSPY